MALEESTFLTSDDTIKLHSTRQYGTGTKTEIYRPMEQDRKPRYKPMHLWVSFFVVDKGGKNIQWGKDNVAKTSSTNGAGKTGQLHVKE